MDWYGKLDAKGHAMWKKHINATFPRTYYRAEAARKFTPRAPAPPTADARFEEFRANVQAEFMCIFQPNEKTRLKGCGGIHAHFRCIVWQR